MATATVQIQRITGGSDFSPAGATYTNITGGTNRAGTADDPAPGGSYPIKIPDNTASNPNYSYWVNTVLSVEAWGGSTTDINNIQWYTDGVATAWGTGISGIVGYTAYGNYQTPGGAGATQGETGEALNGTNYVGLSGLNTNMFTHLQGATALSGVVPTTLGSITSGTVPAYSNIVVYQLAVYPDASAGVTSTPANNQITWQYDEF